MDVEEVVSRIVQRTGIDKQLVMGKIQEKIKELDSLVSEEGAAHIIANELGVSLIDNDASQDFVNIKNLVNGLRNIIVIGKVVDIFPINTFTKGGKELCVGSLSINDGTGFSRVVFWDDNIELFKNIKQGDVLKIINAYVKENKFGKIELQVSFRTKVRINPEEVDLSEVNITSTTQKNSERIDLIELKKDMNVKILGTLVQLFKKNCFFSVCPECNKSVKLDDAVYICSEHGRITPKKKLFISYVIDDGTENIRCTSFGRDAELITGLSTEEAVKLADENEDNSYPIEHVLNKVLGEEFIVYAKSNFSEFSNSVELISTRVIKEIDFGTELKIISAEVKYGDTN